MGQRQGLAVVLYQQTSSVPSPMHTLTVRIDASLFWIAVRFAFRRRFQYSLRTLLLVMTLACIGMSWLGVKMQQARKQREAVEAIEKLGGWVHYDYQVDQSGRWHFGAVPPGPAWLRNGLGEDFFSTVVDIMCHRTETKHHDNRPHRNYPIPPRQDHR